MTQPISGKSGKDIANEYVGHIAQISLEKPKFDSRSYGRFFLHFVALVVAMLGSHQSMAYGTGSNDLGQPGCPKHGPPGRKRFVALVTGPQERLSFLDQTMECSANAAGIAGLSDNGPRENLRHLGLAFPIESIALELCFGRDAIRLTLGSVA